MDESIINQEMKEYIKSSFTPTYTKSIMAQFGLSDASLGKNNPLLSLHFSRWRESICHFRRSSAGICNDPTRLRETCAAATPADASPHASMKPRGDPMLPPAIRAWNDSCRTWACHLYAYATPSPAALDLLATYAPLIEVGAGTGYWAYALRMRHTDVNIVAYDKNPPVAGKDARSNAYHGRAEGWTTVLKGGVEAIAAYPRANLFLCYPPPDSDMALQALRLFKGEYICYCGEYRGDTGTKSFEQLLEQTFSCVTRLALPNWADTCYSLMIWQRRDQTKPITTDMHPLRCVACGSLKSSMLRCRISHSFSVCGEECAAAARQLHLNELAYRYVLCDQVVYAPVSKDVVDILYETASSDAGGDLGTVAETMSKTQKKRLRKRMRDHSVASNTDKDILNISSKKCRTDCAHIQLSLPVFTVNSGMFIKVTNKSWAAEDIVGKL